MIDRYSTEAADSYNTTSYKPTRKLTNVTLQEVVVTFTAPRRSLTKNNVAVRRIT